MSKHLSGDALTELAEEDKAIGALKLGPAKDKVVVTPVAGVFAR